MFIIAAWWWSALLLYRIDGERKLAEEKMRAERERAEEATAPRASSGQHEPRDYPHERRYRYDGPPYGDPAHEEQREYAETVRYSGQSLLAILTTSWTSPR